MDESAALRRVGHFRWVSRALSLIALAGGSVVLALWWYDPGLAVSGWVGHPPVRANHALALALGGVALWLLSGQKVLMGRSWLAAQACATLVLLIGALTLGEQLLGRDLGIDQLLAREPPIAGVVFPGRMVLSSALNLSLCGVSLLLLARRRLAWLQQLLGLMMITIAGLILLGHLYGVEEFQGIAAHTRAGQPGAILAILLGFGLLSAQPDKGMMVVLISDTTGGLLARRLLPAALIVPILLGWLRMEGQRSRLYGTEFGVALLISAYIVVLMGLIYFTARTLMALDRRRQAAEHGLAERADQLTRSNQELEQFAYVASHDLQEPLRVISSFLQLLERKYAEQLDEKARKYISYGVDGAKRMQVLINDLLEFSRVGTRGKPLEPTDCNELLEVAKTNLQAQIDESGAVVSSEPLPVVRADRNQLIQVFQNLISNAIKFRRLEYVPRVHVDARQRNGHWLFSVQDNGIGIGPEYAERIFVIFQRLHTRSEYEGTGIGLAICRKIIERHGGRIWVESPTGEAGSTFCFTLPA